MAENMLYKTALNKAMALCAGREMCLSDIRQKLIFWSVKRDDTDNILNLLIQGKFIDEKRYAAAFVKDKFRYNKWGRIKIGRGLKIKNIPDEIIRSELNSIDDDEYLDLLKGIIAKQRRSIKAKNQFDLKGKLLRHALGRGFESHLIYDLLNDLE
jgi:regulatory protein